MRESTETLEALSNKSAFSWLGNNETRIVDWPSTYPPVEVFSGKKGNKTTSDSTMLDMIFW